MVASLVWSCLARSFTDRKATSSECSLMNAATRSSAGLRSTSLVAMRSARLVGGAALVAAVSVNWHHRSISSKSFPPVPQPPAMHAPRSHARRLRQNLLANRRAWLMPFLALLVCQCLLLEILLLGVAAREGGRA